MPEQKAWQMVWSHKRLWAAHFAAMLTMAALAAGWFWIPESTALAVATSLTGALAIVLCVVVWTGAIFIYFLNPSLAAAVGGALRRLPALVLWALLAGLLIWAAASRLPAWASWIVLPALLAPVGWAVSVHGIRGFDPRRWPGRFLRAYPLVAAAGIGAPFLLTAWHPALPGMMLETVSLAIRWTLASALAVTAWLFLAALLAVQPESPATSN